MEPAAPDLHTEIGTPLCHAENWWRTRGKPNTRNAKSHSGSLPSIRWTHRWNGNPKFSRPVFSPLPFPPLARLLACNQCMQLVFLPRLHILRPRPLSSYLSLSFPLCCLEWWNGAFAFGDRRMRFAIERNWDQKSYFSERSTSFKYNIRMRVDSAFGPSVLCLFHSDVLRTTPEEQFPSFGTPCIAFFLLSF